MTRIGILVVCFLSSSTVGRADDREAVAKAKCMAIKQICEAYKANPANQTFAYPTILLELVKPPFGGAAYLKNAELIDPWGKMYQYAVAEDEMGKLRAFVWTERTVDGKKQVIGTKPPEPKKSANYGNRSSTAPACVPPMTSGTASPVRCTVVVA